MSSNTYYCYITFFDVLSSNITIYYCTLTLTDSAIILQLFKFSKHSDIPEIEGKVSLKRRILQKGLENMAPPSEWSHLSESNLNRAF